MQSQPINQHKISSLPTRPLFPQPNQIENQIFVQPEILKFLHMLSPTSQRPNIDGLEGKELVQEFKNLVQYWQENYKVPKFLLSFANFAAQYLDDGYNPRILASMGNEVAEALKPTMKQMKLPKFVQNTVYYGSWAVALLCVGSRAVLKGLGAANMKSFGNILGQDLVAAIFGPTLWVWIANAVQDRLYKSRLPETISMYLRPLISLVTANRLIPHVLDPIGKTFGNAVTKIVSDDTWNKSSEVMQSWINSLFKKN